jgi:NitT/TauT family transport system substrate-binding protein
MAVIFKAEKGFETIDDLRGRQIAVTHGDALAQIFPAVMRANDIGEDEITLVGTPNPPAKETAVLGDQVDALMGFYTEQAPRLEHTQDVEMDWITFADAGVNTLNMSTFANTDWLAENEDVARRFVRATHRAIEFTADNPQEAAEIFSAAHPDFDVELTLGQIEESLPLLHTEASEDQPYLWSAEEDWAETQRLMVEFADLEERDLDEYFTNDFTE